MIVQGPTAARPDALTSRVKDLQWVKLSDHDGEPVHVEWAYSDMAKPPDAQKGGLSLNTVRMWFRVPEYDQEWHLAFENSRQKLIASLDEAHGLWLADNDLEPDLKKWLWQCLSRGIANAMEKK
jgi:hypothetical protein